jgi:hypothetical protein
LKPSLPIIGKRAIVIVVYNVAIITSYTLLYLLSVLRITVHKLYVQYEHRQLKAVTESSFWMSAATDGASEAKTLIPYTKNDYTFSAQLPFHIQGVTIHG